MTYKQRRGHQNIQLMEFEAAGKYDIPKIEPFHGEIERCEFVGFNYALREKEPEKKGLHFYLDDYQFERLWNRPAQYIEILRRFKYVLAPDFSLFTDFPVALNIFNHYRKHWLAAYYQQNGVNIIPTICWSDKASYEWCFDGEPEGSVVTLSTIGVANSRQATEAFIGGYQEMERRICPRQVLYFGQPIEVSSCKNSGCEIIYFETDQQKRLQELRKVGK